MRKIIFLLLVSLIFFSIFQVKDIEADAENALKCY